MRRATPSYVGPPKLTAAKAFILGLLVISVCACAPKNAGEHGYFVGDVDARWLDDGRRMELLKPFAYVDQSKVEWRAPVGSIVDGASIPQFAWSIVGGPFEGKYRNASVIHDVACVERSRPWEGVHLAFYNAMLASDVDGGLAKIMYAAVYHFGPRWDLTVEHKAVDPSTVPGLEEQAKRVIDAHTTTRTSVVHLPNSQVVDLRVEMTAPARTMSREEFGRLQRAIREKDLSLDEIRNFRDD